MYKNKTKHIKRGKWENPHKNSKTKQECFTSRIFPIKEIQCLLLF